jgi:hypothetical protein
MRTGAIVGLGLANAGKVKQNEMPLIRPDNICTVKGKENSP